MEVSIIYIIITGLVALLAGIFIAGKLIYAKNTQKK